MHVCVASSSCPTLCNPMDCSLPDPFVHGIFPARILEWAAISSPRKVHTHMHTHIYAYMYTHTHTHTHTRFPYSSIRGHSCCFHILTTMNSAAKNNGVQMSPRSRFLLDKYSEVGPLDPIEALFLFFEEPPFCLQ